MTPEQQSTSFGAYLQTARVESNMSIETLAAETRIREEVLRRLEAEEHESLPDEVYVRGFIRSYAMAVGADVEEALGRYRATRARLNEISNRRTTASARPQRFWLGFVAAVGAVLLMAGLTLHIYSRLAAPPALPAAVGKTDALSAEKQVPAAIAEKADVLPAEKPAAAAVVDKPDTKPEEISAFTSQGVTNQVAEEPRDRPQPYRLEIKAIEETWLKIIVDDQRAQELTLKAGAVKQIEATTHFNLLIGNAGGVELKLNDAPVAVSGQSGQVVNLELP
jgi:cytoskeletal protein RodZ